MNAHYTRIKATWIAIAGILLFGSCVESPHGVAGSGTIEATEVVLSARSQGELLQVLVEEGDIVSKGQLLAMVDPGSIELELNQAELRSEVMQAQLELLLAGAREEDLQLAEASLDQARQSFELVEKTYTRIKSSYEGGGTSTSEFDKARTDLDQARSRVRAAEAQLEKLQGLVRPQELRSARAQVAEAQAAAQRVRARLTDTRIVAPRGGTITTKVREAGEYVTPGIPLFTIADLTRVRLTIYVPELDLPKIVLGQNAAVYVDGRPGQAFTGRITHVAEEAEFTPKNVQTTEARSKLVYAVEIGLDNPDGVFKIGMPAAAQVNPLEP